MEMDKEITAIEKGYGEDSNYYKLGYSNVTKIIAAFKGIEFDGNGITKDLLVYHVYAGDHLICEIESNSGITVYY